MYNYIVVCNSMSYSTLTLFPSICKLLRDSQPESRVKAMGYSVISKRLKNTDKANMLSFLAT